MMQCVDIETCYLGQFRVTYFGKTVSNSRIVGSTETMLNPPLRFFDIYIYRGWRANETSQERKFPFEPNKTE